MGSCVVPLNVQPMHAMLADNNEILVQLYQEFQSTETTSSEVKSYLEFWGNKLLCEGDSVYYRIRDRFNHDPNTLDFIFLNRTCFNGLIRFNKKGEFNTPFGRNAGKLSVKYIEKIVDQVVQCKQVLANTQWKFKHQDWRITLDSVTPDDFVYIDPPYTGRNATYYGQWSLDDMDCLIEVVKALPCSWAMSTWLSYGEQRNGYIVDNFIDYEILSYDHFYRVGSFTEYRNTVEEGLILSHDA